MRTKAQQRGPGGGIAAPDPDRRAEDASSAVTVAVRAGHLAGHHHPPPDEPGHHRRGGFGEDLAGRRDLLDPTFVHDRDTVAERHRLRLVVGHVDHRRAALRVKPAELRLHGLAQVHVEVRERLVEQHHPRLHDQAAGEGHPLALSPGKIGGPALAELRHVDLGEGRPHACRPSGRRHFPHPERIADVLGHAHVWPQRVGLEDHADPSILRRNVQGGSAHGLVVETDGPAVRPFETGEETQQRRLAASGGAEKREELPLRDLHRHPVDGGVTAEPPGQVLETQSRQGTTPFGSRCANASTVPMSPRIAKTARTATAAARTV